MIKLLIIADDFTGALDTGVQFATVGASTKVITGYEQIIEEMKKLDDLVDVLVVNTESRHMQPEEAYKVIYDIAKRARQYGVLYILKKTDSALRGNIGSELTALLDATEVNHVHFIPALPKMKRITKNGNQLIDNIPVHESVFAKDPFKPVTASYIPEIIAQQSDVNVSLVEEDLENLSEYLTSIVVYDAESDERIQQITRQLNHLGELKVIAGCAGVASVLAKVLKIKKMKVENTKKINRLLILCGSVNPITQRQLDYAEEQGAYRIRLKPHQKLSNSYYETEQGMEDIKMYYQELSERSIGIIDSNDIPGETIMTDYVEEHQMSLEDVRMSIASTMGLVLKKLFEEGLDSTTLITGGDTLIGFMNQMNIFELNPLYEMAPGTVLNSVNIKDKDYKIISKSGGFGDEKLFVELAEKYILQPV